MVARLVALDRNASVSRRAGLLYCPINETCLVVTVVCVRFRTADKVTRVPKHSSMDDRRVRGSIEQWYPDYHQHLPLRPCCSGWFVVTAKNEGNRATETRVSPWLRTGLRDPWQSEIGTTVERVRIPHSVWGTRVRRHVKRFRTD